MSGAAPLRDRADYLAEKAWRRAKGSGFVRVKRFTFGMKFSIDLVYLDRHYRVRKIRKNVPPWRLSACLTAHSVVELAASSLRDSDLRAGDIVEFSPSQAPH